MSSKQFPVDHDIVLPSLKALVRTNPNLNIIEHEKVVYLRPSGNKVTLLSGGGSGHEPTHAGFVGDGLLDAAVAGSVFASPSTKQIQAGLKAIENPNGTLVIVKNYTGDVIHFGLAAERVRASSDGATGGVEVVVVGDDVSVGRAKGGKVGRRGLAATVLVHKVSGAAAAQGKDLSAVAKVAQAVANNAVTIAASLDHCNVPGRTFETNLTENEIEIGMGIHNEPGVKKVSPIPTVPDLVKSLLPYLISKEDKDRTFVDFGASDEVVLLVNNLGGLSNLELGFIANVVLDQLEQEHGFKIVRVITGTFITAMNGAGFSITLLNASQASKAADADVVELVDAPANAPGWAPAQLTSTAKGIASSGQLNAVPPKQQAAAKSANSGIKVDLEQFKSLLTSGLDEVKKQEPKITHYDTVAGDGDCGETLVAGANGVEEFFAKKSVSADAIDLLLDLAEIVEDSMGGTSGGLYSIFLNALANSVKQHAGKASSLDVALFAVALPVALESLYKYTRARPGDRTLIDALTPFVETLSKTKDFKAAVESANKGAESTRDLEANFGRASYVAKEEFEKEGGIPDPGAIGLAALLKGILAKY
jgi:dihydroxyacetone kinase